MLPHAGSRCRQYDGATAEVFATSLSFRKPKFASVCPTSARKRSRELHSFDETDASLQVEKMADGGSFKKAWIHGTAENTYLIPAA